MAAIEHVNVLKNDVKCLNPDPQGRGAFAVHLGTDACTKSLLKASF